MNKEKQAKKDQAEDQAILAEKLYRSHETVKALYKDEFPVRMKWYIDHINKMVIVKKVTVMEALTILCSIETVQRSPETTMLFMAAAVEVLEPSGDQVTAP